MLTDLVALWPAMSRARTRSRRDGLDPLRLVCAPDHARTRLIAMTTVRRPVMRARAGWVLTGLVSAGLAGGLLAAVPPAIAAPAGIGGFSGGGGRVTTAGLSSAGGLAVDGAGNAVIADTADSQIAVVAARSGRFYGRAMIVGHVYRVAGNGTAGYRGDRGRAVSAELDFPAGVTVDRPGNLVIADTENQRIRVVAVRSGRFYGRAMTAGDIYTVAGNGTVGFRGDGGRANSARLNLPEGVAVDHSGNLVIAVRNSQRIRVVAVRSGRFYGRAMTAGDIYTVAGSKDMGFSGDGGPATSASPPHPHGTAGGGAGAQRLAQH